MQKFWQGSCKGHQNPCLNFSSQFLPRDAMHKRGYSRHVVSVCLSVCLSRSWIMSERINISSNFFHNWVATRWHRSSFSTPNGMAIFRPEPPERGRRMQLGYRQKSRSWRFSSWLSKIAGRAKCQKHLPTTKLSIWHTTGYRSIAGRANYEVTKTVTDDHAV